MKNTVKYQHKALVDQLVSRRKERHLSQEALALSIGVDTKLFGQWERKLVEPKLFNLLCWCEALQVYLTISTDDGEF
jgi:transcriptional regulator with XRE-family HTH domain|tara:strand:+ start:4005 stop:4235 length:231 start_codon:yes stop_codon:yes gene_type:complete